MKVIKLGLAGLAAGVIGCSSMSLRTVMIRDVSEFPDSIVTRDNPMMVYREIDEYCQGYNINSKYVDYDGDGRSDIHIIIKNYDGSTIAEYIAYSKQFTNKYELGKVVWKRKK